MSRIEEAISCQWKKESFSAGGFVMDVAMAEKEKWKLEVGEKTVNVSLPLDFTFKKPEGLFSVEGEGGIRLNICCRFEVTEDRNIEIDADLISHDWFRTPTVSIGSLDIPFEFLANIIVNRVKENHWDNWMSTFNSVFNISHQLSELQENYARNIKISQKPDFYANFFIKQWVFVGFQDLSSSVKLILYANYEAAVSDKPSPYKPQKIVCVEKPVAELMSRKTHQIQFSCSYEGLERILMLYVNKYEIGGRSFDVEKIIIRNTSVFEIRIFLRSPLQGTVTITSVPYFNQEKMVIDFANIKVDVTASQFLYQLSSPIIEKIIRNRIEDIVPLLLADRLTEIKTTIIGLVKNKGINLTVSELTLSSIDFTSSDISSVFSINEFAVSALSDEWKVASL
jgi:hypothetical protein